ncbi:MAG: hypothetical protein ABI045_06985 [Flavobacteriales bacterium]
MIPRDISELENNFLEPYFDVIGFFIHIPIIQKNVNQYFTTEYFFSPEYFWAFTDY